MSASLDCVSLRDDSKEEEEEVGESGEEAAEAMTPTPLPTGVEMRRRCCERARARAGTDAFVVLAPLLLAIEHIAA